MHSMLLPVRSPPKLLCNCQCIQSWLDLHRRIEKLQTTMYILRVDKYLCCNSVVRRIDVLKVSTAGCCLLQWCAIQCVGIGLIDVEGGGRWNGLINCLYLLHCLYATGKYTHIYYGDCTTVGS